MFTLTNVFIFFFEGLPSIEPLSVEEDRLLSDAYQAMSRMQNNTTIDVGKSGM
jgi:hypothetical protein